MRGGDERQWRKLLKRLEKPIKVPLSNRKKLASPAWVSLKRHLFLQAIRKQLTISFVSRGVSMSPFIEDGDRLVVKPIPVEKIDPGSIVCFSNPHIIVHRLIGKFHHSQKKSKELFFLTKGDALTYFDKELKSNKALGIVIKIEKKRGPQRSQIDLTRPTIRLRGRLIASLTKIIFKFPLLQPLSPNCNKILSIGI